MGNAFASAKFGYKSHRVASYEGDGLADSGKRQRWVEENGSVPRAIAQRIPVP